MLIFKIEKRKKLFASTARKKKKNSVEVNVRLKERTCVYWRAGLALQAAKEG